MRRLKLIGLAGAALALAGCSLARPYAPPQMTIPTAYKETGPWTPASPADAAPRGSWWTVYGDETLNRLEQMKFRMKTQSMFCLILSSCSTPIFTTPKSGCVH